MPTLIPSTPIEKLQYKQQYTLFLIDEQGQFTRYLGKVLDFTYTDNYNQQGIIFRINRYGVTNLKLEEMGKTWSILLWL
jgi:hypothetical protein